jgi:xanthine dehydrogenase YagS FAD-binding subunit
MPAFELFQPATIGDVVTLLNRYGSDAWIMAGGMDSFDWLKDRIKRPKVVIDLSQVEGLRGIKALDNGLEIGAGTTLTEIVRDPLVREKFGLLTEAAELVASPQIRNQGTIGGNVSQDTRCWYYRAGWSCYRAGGNICYADTPTAINRERDSRRRPVRGGEPADTAPALVALMRRWSSERWRHSPRPRRGLLVGPDIDITRMTALAPAAADGDSNPVSVGRRAVLLREGA